MKANLWVDKLRQNFFSSSLFKCKSVFDFEISVLIRILLRYKVFFLFYHICRVVVVGIIRKKFTLDNFKLLKVISDRNV